MPETPGCECTEPMEVYSEEEKLIGTWIDGSPLYRMVITGKVSATAGDLLVFAGLANSNIRQVCNLTGMIETGSTASGTAYYQSLPMYAFDGNGQIIQSLKPFYSVERKQLEYKAYSNAFANKAMIIIIEYVKNV